MYPIRSDAGIPRYDTEHHNLKYGGRYEKEFRGEIVNVSVDERVLDENGNVDPAKASPITFDPFNNTYLRLGEKVGNAFSDGKRIK